MFLYGAKEQGGGNFPDKSLARIQVTLRFTTPSAARAESVLLGVKQQGIQAGYVGFCHVSHEKDPRCLGNLGYYITQLYNAI